MLFIDLEILFRYWDWTRMALMKVSFALDCTLTFLGRFVFGLLKRDTVVHLKGRYYYR